MSFGKTSEELTIETVPVWSWDARVHSLLDGKLSQEWTIRFKAFCKVVDVRWDGRREEMNERVWRSQLSSDVSEAKEIPVAIRFKLTVCDMVGREELLVNLPAKHTDSSEDWEPDVMHPATDQHRYCVRDPKGFADYTPDFFC